MVRKTITIRDDIYQSLESNQISEQYQSFSEMVSSALKLLIEKQKKEQYKRAMIAASNDKLYQKDMQKIEEEFLYSDDETHS